METTLIHPYFHFLVRERLCPVSEPKATQATNRTDQHDTRWSTTLSVVDNVEDQYSTDYAASSDDTERNE